MDGTLTQTATADETIDATGGIGSGVGRRNGGCAGGARAKILNRVPPVCGLYRGSPQQTSGQGASCTGEDVSSITAYAGGISGSSLGGQNFGVSRCGVSRNSILMIYAYIQSATVSTTTGIWLSAVENATIEATSGGFVRGCRRDQCGASGGDRSRIRYHEPEPMSIKAISISRLYFRGYTEHITAIAEVLSLPPLLESGRFPQPVPMLRQW